MIQVEIACLAKRSQNNEFYQGERCERQMSGSLSIANAHGIDWTKIEAAFGQRAAVAGEIHRYGLPRTRSAGDAGT
jgi:hypothetical protein